MVLGMVLMSVRVVQEARQQQLRGRGWDPDPTTVAMHNPTHTAQRRNYFTTNVSELEAVHKHTRDAMARKNHNKHVEYFINGRDPYYFDAEREMDWDNRFFVPPQRGMVSLHPSVYRDPSPPKFPYLPKRTGTGGYIISGSSSSPSRSRPGTRATVALCIPHSNAADQSNWKQGLRS